MRQETDQKLKVLAAAYWNKPENQEMGERIAKKYARDFNVNYNIFEAD